MHLAEFNIGTLRYDWEDPRVADFRDNLDRVFAIAERSPGYVWHLNGAEMEAAQLDPEGPLGGNPRTASTLSVWESAADLYAFTFETVHKRFYERRGEWYDATAQTGPRLVMWWVQPGHKPGIGEAAAKLAEFSEVGESHAVFGWGHLRAKGLLG